MNCITIAPVIIMNLNQLYYFQTLAQYEHYTKASQKLYISQPSLTHAIKELENELHVTLFEKKGRNVYLSEEGKLFLTYVNQALETLEAGKDALKAMHKEQNKIVEISVIPTIINTYFAPILQTFKEDQPNIEIHFRSERTAEVIAGIEAERYDFGICSRVDHANLVFLPLLYEELVLITHQDHPLAKMQTVTLQDIAAYPFITYFKDTPIHQTIMAHFQKENLQPSIYYELDDETSIASMVSLNFGVAIVANNDLLAPFTNIVKRKLTLPPNARTIYLVYQKNHLLSEASQTLIDALFVHKKKRLMY